MGETDQNYMSASSDMHEREIIITCLCIMNGREIKQGHEQRINIAQHGGLCQFHWIEINLHVHVLSF